mmetsp:Transcript_12369/g.19240  ORF Transcript_12369/g.19240 Transcript_12369/m.19240 type:complete len:104 (-) Transcript_12369:518-829(-)
MQQQSKRILNISENSNGPVVSGQNGAHTTSGPSRGGRHLFSQGGGSINNKSNHNLASLGTHQMPYQDTQGQPAPGSSGGGGFNANQGFVMSKVSSKLSGVQMN